ncbi:GrpB family protein [Alkalihalobacillus sp. CinArs1]|uniref:GrpB family protein n=1 Tax=Alkalihalobacillus sp. CinArs1 TaxID=2995314 RepID=UPI0022DDA66B|nr:GrpB family protein [Alkalihalobacillus sp. CinArs1]
MIEIVEFVYEETLRESAENVYRKHKEIITRAIPGAEVYHVGSTAVKGSLTKGDVDLQVRVDETGFEHARTFLDKAYALNEGSSQTSFFGAYEKNDEVLPLGLQLTLKHSEVDHFLKVTGYFKENPSLTTKYNSLKSTFHGKEMEAYRNEKALFMEEVLRSPGYLALSRRYDLYEKVKIVTGEKFVTIEELDHASENEVEELVANVLSDPAFKEKETLNIVCSGEEICSFLVEEGFVLHDETVQVTHDLQMEITESSPFTFVSLNDGEEEVFKDVWADAMSGSFNSKSSLTIEDHLKSVECELGEGWRKSCLTVYEGEKAIGVMMPHIEPGTETEGRLFYFGLVPSERGKGKSKEIHRQGLRFLRDDFGAKSYVGNTSLRNIPMIQTFKANGCREISRNKVYTLRRK